MISTDQTMQLKTILEELYSQGNPPRQKDKNMDNCQPPPFGELADFLSQHNITQVQLENWMDNAVTRLHQFIDTKKSNVTELSFSRNNDNLKIDKMK